MIHPLLPELIALQQHDGYLRHAALAALSERLGIPLNRVYSVASFYRMFRFSPCGKHHIKVCIGAACYVKGAETLFDAFATHLKIPCAGHQTDTSPDGMFTLSKVSCLGCCMLAVAVQIDRHIFGHVTPNMVPHVLRDFLRLSQEETVVRSINDGFQEKPFQPEVRICRCSSCRAAGSARVYKAVESQRRKGGFDFAIKEVGCHGMSYRSPLVMVVAEDAVYHYDRIREHEVKAVLANHFTPASHLRRVVWQGKAFLDTVYRRKSCSFSEKTSLAETLDDTRLVTRNSGITHPESLDEYRANGGFVAFEKAVHMTPLEIVELLERSKLRGRGGGGFPTGRKWRLALECRMQSAECRINAECGVPGEECGAINEECRTQGEESVNGNHSAFCTLHSALKVVICNADEGDPGAFMDRMLLESYPYRVLEGMLIASRVLGAKAAIMYIREEYTQAITVLEKVIASLKEAGYCKRLGEDFDLVLFRGEGAFVCGEETALLESIQGNRGIPRKRPPFPVTCGLNGVPTLINNVETFACVPMILADDGKAFQAIGTEASRGTKAFALAGKVRQGGLIEVPIGVTIGEIVEQHGGGAEEGHTIKAVMIGGPSGGCIPQRHFDLPVDYETLQSHGAMMGSGGLVVLDERDCMVDLSLYFLRFLRDESCGKCVMCREGVGRLCDLVEQLTRNVVKDDALLARIETLARHIQQGSLCALGRTAPNMVLSTFQEFRQEFESHVQNACPAGKCRELTGFQVLPERCIGCTKCVQNCAANAIDCVVLESSQIISEKCVKCGVCRVVCPQQAIDNVCQAVNGWQGRAATP